MKRIALVASSLIALSACSSQPTDGLGLAGLEKLGTVDERFQAYNVEMVEVTGGRFWAPYGGPSNERYRQRPPINLSGTWANNTYLEAEGENLSAPPKGFVQVLKRDQWKGVVAFSKAVDAPIVTSFAVSNGTRGPDGVWKTD